MTCEMLDPQVHVGVVDAPGRTQAHGQARETLEQVVAPGRRGP